jgi:hypothetical protein
VFPFDSVLPRKKNELHKTDRHEFSAYKNIISNTQTGYTQVWPIFPPAAKNIFDLVHITITLCVLKAKAMYEG